MTVGRSKIQVVTGLHIVRKQLKLTDRYYVYAWRGGPCIHTQDQRPPVITHAILAKQQNVMVSRYGEAEDSVNALIRSYEASPVFTTLAKSTREDYELWLTRVSERFGATPLAAFEDRRMRGDIIGWRDLWKDQPRTADKAVNMVSILLGYAQEIGRINVNIAAGIKQLHHVTRADLIWEEEHWDAWYRAEVPQHLADAIFLDSWTGLRLGDLVAVSWAEYRGNAIVRMTNKGRKKQARAVIPVLPPLKTWLEQVPEEERVGTILKNSRGKPWTESGLGCVFQRHKPEGFERTIHDLRGTFCTQLILKRLTDDECAMVMGWTSKRVAAVRARYVDEARVILSLAERLSA